jgi:hypothetical protein
LHKWSVRLLALVASIALTACGERLEGGAACPALCSGESLALKDTTIDAVAIDTTLPGFPPRGSANFATLTNSGDTVEVRYIVRFDSLIGTYRSGADTLPVTVIDSAYVRLSIEEDISRFSGPVTFEAYDVDTSAVDSVTTAVLPLFRPLRLIGSVTVDSAALKDSVVLFLNNGAVAAKITTQQRLRIGIRVRSAQPVRIAVLTANTGGSQPLLRYDPAPSDTSIHAVTVVPRSQTPIGEPRLALDFVDYNVVAAGPPLLPPGVIGVGGPRGYRAYFRFAIPARITDSTTVVRASLVLTQKPTSTYGFADSIIVAPQVVIATKEITDLAKAVLITDTLPGRTPPSIFTLPSLRFPPTGNVERHFDIADVVRRFWLSASSERVPQAIVLRSTLEGIAPVEAQFYSMEAPAALRPRLLITYLPRTEFGIP